MGKIEEKRKEERSLDEIKREMFGEESQEQINERNRIIEE